LYPEISEARREDIPGISRLEAACFPDPWPVDLFEECVRPSLGVRTWVARNGGRIIGYVCAAVPVEGILHIANLCVSKNWRRHGVAGFLLDTVESWGARRGAGYGYLEVRTANSSAISLYARRGYLPCEFLPDYYGEGRNGYRLLRSLPRDGVSGTSAALAGELATFLGRIPPVGVVLGSGLSWVADLFPKWRRRDISSLPGMGGGEALPGHPGQIVRSRCGRFVFLLGRRHHYQGFGGDEIALLPSTLADLGTRTWLLICSAGGLAEDLQAGSAMVIEDSINLSGCVPTGTGSRCGGAVYSKSLSRIAASCARRTGAPVRKGIFASVSGPAYETAAETLLLKRFGAAAVSMSTVQEALALSSRGCDVLGLAMITNSSQGGTVTHGEVLAAQKDVEKHQRAFLAGLLEGMAEHELR